MYREFKGLNLPDIDKEILEFWEKEDIFKKSVDLRDPENNYVFYEGPPSANGKPGIHHVIARTVKDLFCRFQTLNGKRVERKGGWDTHGLPIEISVEKELGITKEDIGKKISVDEYNAKCRETVMRYKDMWDDITKKMGYWVDLENPYITFENNYIESVWYLLKRLYDKDLLYKGYTIQPYSPAAGTGLSTHELNMPGAYKDVTDTTVVAQFKAIVDSLPDFLSGKGDIHFLAWTTTPWTLPSNTALTVGAKIDYVLVETYNQYTFEPIKVILAKALVGKQFSGKFVEVEAAEGLVEFQQGDKKIPYFVSQEFKGADLVGIRYEQLLPYAQPAENPENAFRVISGTFVTTEDGTGIVHTAPTFGADDMMVAKQANPPVPPLLVKDEKENLVPLVDLQGRFRKEMGEFGGAYVKNEYYKADAPERSTDVQLAIKLKTENKAFKVEKYKHNYPHCWRTDKPVLYYPLDSWFVRSTAKKARMVELNKQINWKPKHTGEGRFGKWLENLQDWNLSRSRYWGIPLPIWRNKDGTVEKCIGSLEELQAAIDKANEVLGMDQVMPKDLHRPYIDEVVLVSDQGEAMKRELDLIDVWFDSGSMPYAQWHYPFENQEKFKQNFPADFIAEGVDQTRGWFFTLHAIAVMAYDSIAFKNVVSNGLVQDKLGAKMSKSKGNAVEPFETLATHGADATRWYMISNAQPWDNLKFDIGGIQEVKRKFFGTLYNTYSFFALYANIDEFQMGAAGMIPVAERPEIDRWVISKLNSMIKAATAAYADYEPTQACRLIDSFVQDQLSNWYVRLCRRRFWKGEMSKDKQAAYETLYECLVVVSQLMSPVAPFFSDWMYRNLTERTREAAKADGVDALDSIHLTILTPANEDLIDLPLEQRMGYAQRISSLGLSLRKKGNLRVRQPLQKILLPVLDNQFQEQVDAVKPLILAELNVKEVEYLTDSSGFIKKKIKPNFKTLGRKLGKHMKAFAKFVATMTPEQIEMTENNCGMNVTFEGETFDLSLEDFDISTDDIPGWEVASDGPLTVALDVTLNEDLKAEGMARELVNRIQNIRKNKDFNVTDKIVVQLGNHEAIQAAVNDYGDYICNETLAVKLNTQEGLEGEKVELTEGVAVVIDVALN